jgi:hypothetical protein
MLKKIIFLLWACLACSGLCQAGTPLMPVEDIRAGMEGYAKTVISGDTIETFPVKVLGVTGNDAMGYRILVEASGDVMDRSGGISQGMSGSPVYFDGRLAGAIAYGKAFTNSRYCFLTPIESMLHLLDQPVPHYEGLLPKGTALMAGGFTEEGFKYLQQSLEPLGLTALEAGGSGIKENIAPLEPGSSVAVALAYGDMTLGAIGTVTWMDDQGKVLAFGHPFLQRGPADFFMNKAWILASLPNLEASYKVGSLGEVVGTINQDRNAGVAGQVGKGPKTIPVFVSVTDSSRSLNGSVRVQLIDDELLTPALLGSVAANSVSKVFDFAGGGTARVTFDINALDKKNEPLTVHRDNMFYAPSKIIETIPEELVETGKVLLQNKLEKTNILDVHVNVDIDDAARIAEIQKAAVREKEAAPGDLIHIELLLKPYRGENLTKTVAYKVPADAKDGTLRLSVKGGAMLNWIQVLLRQQKEAGVPTLKKKKTEPPDLQTYVKKINNMDRNNDLIIDVAAKAAKPQARPKAADEAQEEESQGSGFDSLLAGTKNKQKFPMDFILDGETTVTVNIKS